MPQEFFLIIGFPGYDMLLLVFKTENVLHCPIRPENHMEEMRCCLDALFETVYGAGFPR